MNKKGRMKSAMFHATSISCLSCAMLDAQEEEDSVRRRRRLLQRGPLGQEPRRLRRRSKTIAEIDTLLRD